MAVDDGEEGDGEGKKRAELMNVFLRIRPFTEKVCT